MSRSVAASDFLFMFPFLRPWRGSNDPGPRIGGAIDRW